jgi:probable HAF family extracellular repeat protein
VIEIVDLGLGGSKSIAQHVNKHGQIVGCNAVGDKEEKHAFLREQGAVLTDLGLTASDETAAGDINDDGLIVGGTFSGVYQKHAVLWEDGKMTDLGTLGGDRSDAVGVNNAGQIIGQIWLQDHHRGFLREPGGEVVQLPTLGGPSSHAWGINNVGQIVGGSDIGGNMHHAYLWDNGSIMDLRTLGGLNSSANAINDHGQVVGESDGWWEPGPWAFLWENGRIEGLASLRGSTASGALDINNNGVAVGYCQVDSLPRACVWEGGNVIALPSLTADIDCSMAMGINDAQQIVGFSDAASVSGFPTWQDYAVLWQRPREYTRLSRALTTRAPLLRPPPVRAIRASSGSLAEGPD